jgi:hypothetical protein
VSPACGQAWRATLLKKEKEEIVGKRRNCEQTKKRMRKRKKKTMKGK